MKTKRGLSYLVILLVLVAVVLAACGDSAATPTTGSAVSTSSSNGNGSSNSNSSTSSSSGGDAATVIKNSQAALANVKDYQATLDMTFTGQGAGTLTMDSLIKGGLVPSDSGNSAAANQFKATINKSTLATVPTGTVVVSNGKDSLAYDPTQKVEFKGANGNGNEVYTLFLGTQLKVLDLFTPAYATATVAGDEKVGSYNTTKLNFTPKPGLDTGVVFGKNAKGTVWVDKDSNLPVQLDYSEDGSGIKWTASNMQVNKGITDAQLSFTPPADAKIVDESQIGAPAKVASLDEAKTKAGFAFPTASYLPADLPKTATSVSVQTTPLGNIISASYSVQTTPTNVTPFPNAKGKPQNNKGVEISAFKSTVNLPSNVPSDATFSDVTVQGQPGKIAVLNNNVTLTFQKDGVFYTINTNSYSKDEVQKIGDGLK